MNEYINKARGMNAVKQPKEPKIPGDLFHKSLMNMFPN